MVSGSLVECARKDTAGARVRDPGCQRYLYSAPLRELVPSFRCHVLPSPIQFAIFAMDPESRTAATAIARRWLHNNPKWNFGRFNTDVDLELYPLFDLQFPLPEDWDSDAKIRIKNALKEYKKGVWKDALTEVKKEKDPSQAVRATEALSVS